MRKAIIIVRSDAELDRHPAADLARASSVIVSRTIIVRTPECVGEAVAIAGTIMTSLLLVRNHVMVTIITPACGETQAVVSSRDERNYIAKLEPVGLDHSERRAIMNSYGPEGKAPERLIVHTGPIGAIGDPLFTTEAREDGPVVTVAGMSTLTKVCERREFEDTRWRMDREPPKGQAGGGVWMISGAFVGLSLARRMPYDNPASLARERLWALPAEEVMDFAETK